jgi:Tfp pilus assembly protein PilN
MSQQINLFNPIFLQQKKMFAARTMAQALGLLLAGALVIAGSAWRSVSAVRHEAADVALQLTKKQARFASAAADFAPRKASASLNGEVGEAEAKLAGLRHVTQLVQNGDLGNPHGYADYFRALGRQHQDGLWLTNVAIAGAGMSLAGRALSATLVPAYITRLAHEPALAGKSFAALQIGQPEAAPATAPAPAPAPVVNDARYIEFSLQANAAEVKP